MTGKQATQLRPVTLRGHDLGLPQSVASEHPHAAQSGTGADPELPRARAS